MCPQRWRVCPSHLTGKRLRSSPEDGGLHDRKEGQNQVILEFRPRGFTSGTQLCSDNTTSLDSRGRPGTADILPELNLNAQRKTGIAILVTFSLKTNS